MERSRIPMVPGRKSSLPAVYLDTPSFLGVPVGPIAGQDPADVIIAGVPWEGTVTWETFSGCELGPRVVRHVAARYGGYLPEYDLDLFDHLKLLDVGDVNISPNSAQETMRNVGEMARRIYGRGAIPVTIGGDHSYPPEVIAALSERVSGRIGVVHLDAHFDNCESWGEDRFPRCGPIHRIFQLDKVHGRNIVHVGIRGPRNSAWQMGRAREMGATVFTMTDIRRDGIAAVIDRAIEVARDGTDAFYVTICSDVIDAGFNPGGPADFGGLFPHELLHAAHALGHAGMCGLDHVEIYPPQDPSRFSAHLVAWTIIYALVGLAAHKKGGGKVGLGAGPDLRNLR